MITFWSILFKSLMAYSFYLITIYAEANAYGSEPRTRCTETTIPLVTSSDHARGGAPKTVPIIIGCPGLAASYRARGQPFWRCSLDKTGHALRKRSWVR